MRYTRSNWLPFVDDMSTPNTFFSDHGRELADFFTFVRVLIIFQILYLSSFQVQQFSFYTIQFWLLCGWITDVLDGRLARLDKNTTSTWIGRNERKFDLIMIGAAHYYLSQFVTVNTVIIYLMGFLGLVAFIQMYRTGDTDLLFQMAYIAIICGYIVIINMIQGQLIGYITMAYFIALIIVNWSTFKPRVIYFVTLGRVNFE